MVKFNLYVYCIITFFARWTHTPKNLPPLALSFSLFLSLSLLGVILYVWSSMIPSDEGSTNVDECQFNTLSGSLGFLSRWSSQRESLKSSHRPAAGADKHEEGPKVRSDHQVEILAQRVTVLMVVLHHA